MPNAPANPYAQLSRPGQKWVVRAGARATPPARNIPTAEDEHPELQVLGVYRFAGGKSLDRMDLVRDGGHDDYRLVDVVTPGGYAREAEVVQIAEDPDEPATLCGWGEILERDLGVRPSGENLTVGVNVAPYHFGQPLRGITTLYSTDGVDRLAIEVDAEIAFEPEIDGRAEHNMLDPDLHPDLDCRVWLDPEQQRTTAAATAQQMGVRQRIAWTLAYAVHTLCWLCNPDETFVKNPTLEYLRGADGDGGVFPERQSTDPNVPEQILAPPVLNVRLPRGRYLPELLDELLVRHGYSWYLDYVLAPPADEPDEPEEPDDVPAWLARWEPRITLKFFRHGAGPEKELLYQRPGESLDPAKTTTQRIEQFLSIADLANRITGYGAPIEREVTVELFRGWPETQDGLREDELARSDSSSQYAEKPNAWRLWVLNEAGDWSGTRTDVEEIPDGPRTYQEIIDGVPYDQPIGHLFRHLLDADEPPRRRRFGDCITLWREEADEPLKRRPPFVEWSNDGGTTWQPAPHEWGPTVLEHQCGIYFGGDTPPGELLAAGQNARLRVTATIRGANRLRDTVERQTSSASAHDVELVLDLADRFFDRQILRDDPAALTTRSIKSVLASEPENCERDDAEDLTAFLTKVRTTEDACGMRAKFEIQGLEQGIQIGDLLTKVKGREISLNRKSPASAEKLYPQVTAIVWDRQKQQTTLFTEAFADLVAEEVRLLAKELRGDFRFEFREDR